MYQTSESGRKREFLDVSGSVLAVRFNRTIMILPLKIMILPLKTTVLWDKSCCDSLLWSEWHTQVRIHSKKYEF